MPSWSRDGQWIYFASNRTGSWQVWKVKAASDESHASAVQVDASGASRHSSHPMVRQSITPKEKTFPAFGELTKTVARSWF